jgi:hypothetical protein
MQEQRALFSKMIDLSNSSEILHSIKLAYKIRPFGGAHPQDRRSTS